MFFLKTEREFFGLFLGVLWPIFGTIFGFLGLLAWGVWFSSTNFLWQLFLMKVLSSLSFIQVSSPNFRDTMLHNFFQRCWLLQYFQSKNFFILDDITTSVWTWKFQVQNYTLSSERESHKHTNNTHVTYSVHLRGSYATETILMKKPYSSVGKSPGETVNSAPKHFLWAIQKFARSAPQSTYIHSLIKKVGCIMVFLVWLQDMLYQEKKSNTKYRLLTHLILWLIHLYAYSYLKKGACEYMNHSTMSLVHSLHTYLNIKCK